MITKASLPKYLVPEKAVRQKITSFGSFNDLISISERSNLSNEKFKNEKDFNDDVSSVASDFSDVGVIKALFAKEKEQKAKSKFYTAGKIKENCDSDFEEEDGLDGLGSDYKGSQNLD